MSGQKATYAICRILGNELPPRDQPGSRIQLLDYILKNEPSRAETKRIWIVNRVLDTTLLNQYKSILSAHSEEYYELPMDWDAYIACPPEDHTKRVNLTIAINNARNQAFKIGRTVGRFVFVLDGDCYFDDAAWGEAIKAIKADQELNPQRQYYAFPMIRVSLQDLPADDFSDRQLEEPQLVMRNDAIEMFDEERPYGDRSKQELLIRLGLVQGPKQSFRHADESSKCITVARILHLYVGSEDAEKDDVVRGKKRTASIFAFLRKSDAVAAQVARRLSYLHAAKFVFCVTKMRIRRKFRNTRKSLAHRVNALVRKKVF